MAIAISANGEHQPAGALSPTDIKAQHVKGGGPSSVQMGQENVIALLLQQQEEVLREIRDHKKVRRTCWPSAKGDDSSRFRVPTFPCRTDA